MGNLGPEPGSRPATRVRTAANPMRHYDDQPIALALCLTTQAVAVLDMLAGPDGLQPEHTRESLALKWISRWARCSGKALWRPDKHVPGTETVTVTVDRSLLDLLRAHGDAHGWEPVDMASAVVNDCASHLSS